MISIPYTLSRSKRKSIAIQIKHDGTIVVRAPLHLSHAWIEQWIASKQSWIKKHMSARKARIYPDQEIHRMKAALKQYMTDRVCCIWKQTDLPPYTHISITRAEYRWGSCSHTNRLCFSYRLAEFFDEWNAYPHLSRTVRYAYIDAIITHELAHLREKHHHSSFWKLVHAIMPEYTHIIQRVKNTPACAG